jgi:phenylacetate-CoA ligase
LVPEIKTLDGDLLRRHAAELVDRTGWSRSALAEHQRVKLRQAIRHASARSPYYQETIGELAAREAPLDEFPILTKRLVMSNFDRIVTDRRLTRMTVEKQLDGPDPGGMMFDEYRAFATGGTTGERGVFVYSNRAWLSVMANIVRFQRLLGILPSTRSVGIAAASPIHMSYRFYAESRAIRPDSPRLDLTMPVPQIVGALNAYQPEAVTTYPSFIRVLASEQAAGRLKITPRLLRTGAEALTQQVRELASEMWNAPVINSYSSTEVGTMGHECLHLSGLHLAEDLCHFEVVDEHDQPVPEGTCGAKLLVTTLENETLPLIRYELTDLVTLTTEPCPCGLPFARISSIEGRSEDVLQLPKKGGGAIDVHALRLRSPLIGTEGVRQFQLGKLPDGLEITISVLPEFDSAAIKLKVERSILAVLDKLAVAPMRILVTVVDQIERTGAGAKERLIAKAKPESAR